MSADKWPESGECLISVPLARVERFDHCIVEARTNLFDGVIRAVGPGAVGKQRD